MERFFISAYGPDAEAEQLGLAWLVREARTRSSDAAVVVPSVGSIEGLSRAIGADGAAFAKKHRHFVASGVHVGILSSRTMPTAFHGPVLVPWANDDMVHRAEDMRPGAICALPWTKDDLSEWKRAWNPIDVRTGDPIGEMAATISSPLVERALVSLTRTVNLSSGIHHPSDERHAKRLLKSLFLCGEPLDEVEIRTWAISHGWQPRHADDLATLAGKIAAGRRVMGTAMTKTEAKQVVARLRELDD